MFLWAGVVYSTATAFHLWLSSEALVTVSAVPALLLSLAVTPLRRLLGWNWLVKPRRTLGLAAFGYATTHLLVYFVVV